ncbi:MAG: hypothetical protein Q8R00_04260 [Candidatus Nanoarchaeia archaeon]|nr:hypothetical protein [Candidatus Nanoarchaeia archaeon]
MKLSLLAVVFILCSTFVNANLIILVTSSDIYLSEETVQLEIFVQNPEVQPTASNIRLLDLEDNLIKVAPLFNKIESNHYYAYFDLPKLNEGNYKIQLYGLKFKVDNVLKEISEELIINVTKGTPTLSIKPGFFSLENKPKELELQLITKDEKVEVNFETADSLKHPYSQKETVIKESSRKFFFQFTPLGQTYNSKIYINLSYSNESYSIPIFVITGLEKIETKETFEFLSEVQKISKTLDKSQEISGTLGIKNILNETLNNIRFELSDELKEIIILNLTEKDSLQPSEIINILFIINKNKNPSKLKYVGDFKVISGSNSKSFPIEIGFNEEVPETINKSVESQKETPKELELFKLPPPIQVEKKQESKLGLYLVIIITILFAYIIYKLTRKQKQKKSFKEYITKIKS